MTKLPRHVWLNEQIKGNPAVKFINLAYDEIEKITLSFLIDLTSSQKSALDASRPIRINDNIVNIADLPKDPYSLSYIERSDIDVTNLLRYSPKGENNKIEVFYRGGGGNLLRLKKPSGILNMTLTFFLPEKVVETKQSKIENYMFCIFCRKEIPDVSKYCLHCGVKQEGGGRDIKSCVTCNISLPSNARFCRSCGSTQPK